MECYVATGENNSRRIVPTSVPPATGKIHYAGNGTKKIHMDVTRTEGIEL